MPLYDFRDLTSGEVYTKMMSIADMVEYVKDKNVQQVIGAPMIVGGTGDRVKVDGGFQDVLSKIASTNIDTPMGERHHRKSGKEVKTREIVKKHVGMQTKGVKPQ
jgi:hypothetical protein|tara:strand:- start:97 stop:411 length:315 start_codon:yes stop_codon:yes gene_type:complete